MGARERIQRLFAGETVDRRGLRPGKPEVPPQNIEALAHAALEGTP